MSGNSGVFVKTIDGGATWSNEIKPSSVSGTSNINIVTPKFVGSNQNIFVGGSAGQSGAVDAATVAVASLFYYDQVGRLVASQNAKQFSKDPFTYSYTKYDALNRITEVGEVRAPANIPVTTNGQVNVAAFNSWLSNTGNVLTEITKTVYDLPPNMNFFATYDGAGTFSQNQFNLRNRVSYTTYQDVSTTLDHLTFYDYDIHGNVRTLYQCDLSLPAGNKYKRLDYEYDLISGNVNTVSYQNAGERSVFSQVLLRR